MMLPILSGLYCPGLQASCVNISITSGTQTMLNPTIDNSGCSAASGIGYSAATGGSLIINNNSLDNANYTNTTNVLNELPLKKLSIVKMIYRFYRRILGRILTSMVFLICPSHDRQCHYSLVLIGIKN